MEGNCSSPTGRVNPLPSGNGVLLENESAIFIDYIQMSQNEIINKYPHKTNKACNVVNSIILYSAHECTKPCSMINIIYIVI